MNDSDKTRLLRDMIFYRRFEDRPGGGGDWCAGNGQRWRW